MDLRQTVHAVVLATIALPVMGGLPANLHAQTPDSIRQDTVYEVEPIAVRAVRPSATTGGVSAITVRLDSVRFRPAPLLEDVLREIPLVQVRTNSRGEAQLALRGAEERQIAILLDGVPLTLGWDHRTDLSVIPMTAAQSVQLVRGMSSILHGPNVLGGVVEIRIGAAPAGRVEPLQLSAGVDQTGSYSAGAVAAADLQGAESRLTVRGGAGWRDREGLAAPGDVTGVYPALTDGDLLPNSHLRHVDGFFSARLQRASGAWMSTTVSGFQAERGVLPELHEESPRLWRYPEVTRTFAVLAGGVDGIQNDFGNAGVEVSMGADIGSTLIEDFALPVTAASDAVTADALYRSLAETETADDRTLTLRARGSQSFGAARITVATTAADVRHDEVITVGLLEGQADARPGSYRQRLWSLAAEADMPFEATLGPLTGGRISGGVAWDGADTPDSGPSQAAGEAMTAWGGRLGVSASTGGAVLFHSGVSRRGRFPALREMYSTALGRFHPNPDLRPEVLTAVEAGFTSRFGRYDLQVVGFHQRLDDAIARGAPPVDSDARYMRVNRNEIRSTGLEVLAGFSLNRLTLETEMTLQSVEVVEPGEAAVRAEYEPAFAGGVGGAMPLFAGIEAAAEIEYWSEQYCSAPSPGEESYLTLEPSTRTDVQLVRSFRLPRSIGAFQRAGLELAIDNVMDAAVYDQCGLPQPGRTFRLQLRLN